MKFVIILSYSAVCGRHKSHYVDIYSGNSVRAVAVPKCVHSKRIFQVNQPQMQYNTKATKFRTLFWYKKTSKLTVKRQLAQQTAAHDPTQYRKMVRSFSLKNNAWHGAPQFFVSCKISNTKIHTNQKRHENILKFIRCWVTVQFIYL